MDIDELRALLESGSDEQKLFALKEVRNRISNGETFSFFDLAKALVESGNNDIRWQAIIVIGEYIPRGHRNEDIWNVIVQHLGIDEDMQDALATVLLEHLLEHHFDWTVNKIESALEHDGAWLVDVVKRCWRFGQPEHQWHRIENLIERYEKRA
jgi:hypothetical protein